MTRLVGHHVILACAAASMAMFAACNDDSPGARSGGMISSPSASLAVGIPASMALIPITGASCPMTQPFATSFDLFVSPSTDAVAFDSLTLQFLDGFGTSSTLFFSTKDLLLIFGNTTILAGTRRAFTLQPEFGCGLSTPRSVIVVVDLIDVLGGRHQATATATLH